MALDVDPSGAATESAGADDTAHAAVPAGWPARAGAFAIDVLAGVGLLAAVFLLASAAPARGWLWWLALGVGAVVFLAMAVNRLLLPATTGWSLGRSVFGIRVVRRDGSPAGPWLLLLRDLAHLLDTAALFIGWFWPLWDSRRRTFADLLVRTEVRRVEGDRPDRRRVAGATLGATALVAVAAATLGYLFIYRHDLNNDRAREEIAVQGPQIVAKMLSYQKASLDDDFARAQTLVTDAYRPQLVAQQDAVRKAGPVDNDYWSTNSAVLSNTADHAAMLILLQGQRGAADKARLITATVRVNFEKSAADQWQVADLTVLARPNPGQG